ncbi:MAG: hypothetical protein IJG84_20430 [Kiritimatiellae bacterium]|nr:hypothetical protein [Kiritimatiellia bacterium]
MRTRIGTIHIVVLVALAVGAAAGWFAAWGRGKNKCENVEVCKYGNVETANGGGAGVPDSRVRRSAIPDAKPLKKSDATAEMRREPEAAKQEEKLAQVAQPELQKDDNPFPRYLDMFKNNPEALVAEFQKEAEADRASLAGLRKGIIDELKLNAEQAVVFEKALDDLRDEVMRINEEYVGLIESGQLNDEDDGSILTSNRILGERFVAARETAKREAAEKLYEQLELDGVSDAKKQAFLFIAAQRTSFSYECHEPYLSVYDKIYKNFGFGNGIFSWCSRARRQGGK